MKKLILLSSLAITFVSIQGTFFPVSAQSEAPSALPLPHIDKELVGNNHPESALGCNPGGGPCMSVR